MVIAGWPLRPATSTSRPPSERRKRRQVGDEAVPSIRTGCSDGDKLKGEGGGGGRYTGPKLGYMHEEQPARGDALYVPWLEGRVSHLPSVVDLRPKQEPPDAHLCVYYKFAILAF
ncbi:hypothetical protein MRX96_012041 [Rhipicephalus microplus]